MIPKPDASIRNIALAAARRSMIDPGEWRHSWIIAEDHDGPIPLRLEKEELPLFMVNGSEKSTLITTRGLYNISDGEHFHLPFGRVDRFVHGNFKGQPGQQAKIHHFNAIDLEGTAHPFVIETGKASVGFIRIADTILKMYKHHPAVK